MPYLFQISIGPVQSLIRDARRTRDLKFSSSFLSELARTAARAIRQQDEAAQLIFPSDTLLEEDRKLKDAPNKVLAYIEISPNDLAAKVKEAIDARIEAFWKQVVKRIGAQSFEDEKAKRQIQDLVEYVWVAVPYDETAEPYQPAHQKLDALLAARKNTRDFAPVSWGSDRPKSSINGQLEGVIPESAYPLSLSNIERATGEQRKRLMDEYRRNAEALRRYFDAGPHEKLSGVDLLKRLGPIDEREESLASEGDSAGNEKAEEEGTFPSTSHMAALPFLRGLYRISSKSNEARERADAWKHRYISELKQVKEPIPFEPDILPSSYRDNNYWPKIFSLGIYDGALLFPERFPDVVGDTQAYKGAREQFQKAIDSLEQFLREIDLRPTPYYALLAADGDFMGRVIDWQARAGMKPHQELSKALAAFASEAGKTIKQQEGVCIYSGGDDVLALLPLHTAVQCASKLAQQFRSALDRFQDEKGRAPTLSAGLAVVHHLHPLWDALTIARAAEGRAKSSGKDALAITIQKRGGPPCEVGGRWEAFVPRLERLIDLCQDGVLPSGMAYELEEIALCLEPVQDHTPDQEISPPHVQYAALRVFQRKLSEMSSEKEQALRDLKGMIGPGQYQPVRVGQLANELVVARLFAQARLLAAGHSEGEGE